MNITIETIVSVPLNEVWSAWVTPEDIIKWNFASEEWHCPKAELDLVMSGRFNYRMEAKDGSMGFDFEGEFTEIRPQQKIKFNLFDDRPVLVEFQALTDGVKVIETFKAETENPIDMQRDGWQCILNNFKKHVEATYSK